MASPLCLLEPALQVCELLADLVQHLVEGAVLGIILVKLGLVAHALLHGDNGGVGTETRNKYYLPSINYLDNRCIRICGILLAGLDHKEILSAQKEVAGPVLANQSIVMAQRSTPPPATQDNFLQNTARCTNYTKHKIL